MRAATIGIGEVTSALGPTFFVDDASTGGGDTSALVQPAVGSYTRSFAGLVNSYQGRSRVMLTGFGFATANAPADHTATSLTITFTYLGADELVGGGDDVVMGSATGNYHFTANGEYVFAFDTPITADLDITGMRFLIQVAPANATTNGRVRFKTGALTYEAAIGPKFSVAGVVAPQRVNLAKFQPVTVDSTNGQFLASYVTDGVAGNENRWQSNGSGPHWARVDFPFPIEAGSAQVFTGFDDINAQANFKIQYLNGSSWVDAPGAVVTGNTDIERNIVFTTPVTASSFRAHSSDGTLRLRELALYPPNGVTGFPLGADVRLNLAQQRPAVANANTAGNFALLAVDGRVNKDSKWQTSTAGTNSLEIDLIVSTKIGSAHFYSGSPGVGPLADFVLKSWDGTAWQNIPGGTVTGNTTADRVVSFTTPVTTSKVRLEFTNPGTTSVRELCIFPANNGNPGYPLGSGVTGVPPSAAEFDDYTDAFYQISNPAAGTFIAAGGSGQPALSQAGQTTGQGQYQILLNISTGTYRLRNRATGNCLSGAQLAIVPGEPLTDAPYAALPHQDWILDPLDGGAFQLVNQWSGLAIDVQAGGTAPGTPLVQNPANGSTSQRWQALNPVGFPKKGVGGGSFVNSFNADWMYGWGLTTTATLPAGSVFQPMQWGNYNWTYNTSAASIWKLYPTWRTNSRALHLLGFNEPDANSQSGNSLDTENTGEADFSLTRSMEKAVELWPRLLSMDLPLVSPAPANMNNGWLADFYNKANALGYRVDYTALHSYPSPGGGSSDGLVNTLLSGHNTWGRPVWLTEFSFVNWNGSGTWTEEDNYNCLAEFIWRAESLPWLRKYALFVFREAGPGNPNNPPSPAPEFPWSPVGPRSNSLDLNDNLTAFGKLYSAWDGDAAVRTDKTYYIHNKSTRKRLANLLGSGPNARSIRVDDHSPRWTLVSTGASNRYYLVSSRDGRRLSYASSAITLAAANTTGTAVEWSLTQNQYGWYYLNHPATSTRLQLAFNNTTSAATYTVVANTNTADAGKWRFIVPPPLQPPPAWSGASGTSWITAGNWTSGSVPVTGDAANFDSSSTANLNTVLNQDFNLAGATVTSPAGAVSIGGTHRLTLGASGIDLAAASQNLTITAPVVLGAAQSWNVASGRTLSVNGGVAGSSSFTVEGAGKVSLAGVATHTGNTTINPGATLLTSAASVLPAGATAGGLVVNGTLDLNGTSQSINGLSGSGVVDNTGGGEAVLTVGGNDVAVTFSCSLQNTTGTLALLKTGGGGITLPRASTHSGGFTNNATGNVSPQNNAAFGSGPVVMNAATLYSTAGNYTFNNALTLNGAVLRVGGGSGRTLTWTGPVSVTADSIIQSDGTTGGITVSGSVTNHGFTLSSAPNGTSNTISGPISGSGTIMSATFATGALNLNAANPFGGSYRAAMGTLKIGNALAMHNATLDMNAADVGAVNLNNLNATLGALTGSRNLGLGSGTVSIGNNHLSSTYSGVLGGTGSLVKTGNGTLTLSGPNSYSGTTSVNAGTLALGARNVLPDTAVSIGNATLNAATFTDTAGTLDVTSTASINLGAEAALAFANSSAVDWTGGTLHITGTFVSGSSIQFGATSGGLTPVQLALITVNGGGGPFILDANGFLATPPIADPYTLWSGGAAFDADANEDGVENGLAWLLGAASPSENAISKLPAVSQTGGDLVLTFRCLKVAGRGGAQLNVQHSSDLGLTDVWASTEVPDADSNVNNVAFDTTADGDFIDVVATIPTGEAAAGKLFGRLKAERTP